MNNSVRANTNYLLSVYMTRQRHQIKIVRVTLMIDKRIADFLHLSALNLRLNIYIYQRRININLSMINNNKKSISRIYFEQNDNYKCAHRFYSLPHKIRYVHTYYKNKEAECWRNKIKEDKAHIYIYIYTHTKNEQIDYLTQTKKKYINK